MHLTIDTDDPRELMAEARRLAKAHKTEMVEEAKRRKVEDKKRAKALEIAEANALHLVQWLADAKASHRHSEILSPDHPFLASRLGVDGNWQTLRLDGGTLRIYHPCHTIARAYYSPSGFVGVLLRNTHTNQTPDTDTPETLFAIGVFGGVVTTYAISSALTALLPSR
jgi:hypothetical protein